ncbi:GNAT family N-acetyltransferase [Sabulicella rubraurantiaca]|uniref:GNAT family N-acetyltransferase n=1 Tax=Sabulicella rubraurantiaca TaxID=2811429 RepID=UPI001F2D7D3E|nr:GNAT family N-acetyltransferase [Sabulicella rubraurantiaca]
MTTIRRMTRRDLERALDWAAAEGWNPGQEDATCFFAADPEGFLLAEAEGQPVASISAVRMGEGFGFIGLYIAIPEARGQGHGMALWRAGMEHLRGRCIGLDGVVAQQANYRKSGFVFAWNNARYEAARPMLEAAQHRVSLAEFGDELLAYDALHTGVARPEFLRAWVEAPSHVARVIRGRDGTLCGFGVLRPCREGSKIGPLFAEDASHARSLLTALAAERPEGKLVLDVAEDHEAAVRLAREAGMEKVFETARMYTDTPPPMRREGVFGITSFELG